MGAHYTSLPHLSVPARGILKNYNTIEEFKNADKRALFNKLSDEVCGLLRARLNKSLPMTGANGLAP
jgi:ubiquitin-like modifier-activating enzyme ATG7